MPDYFTVELDLWSMADLMAVKKGSFHDVIRFVKQCDEHVKQCEVRTIDFSLSNCQVKYSCTDAGSSVWREATCASSATAVISCSRGIRVS